MRIVIAIVLLFALRVSARPALTADDLALVVNVRQPEGKSLAEHYASVRKVPDGRIIEIDVEDQFATSFESYRDSILNPIRSELEARGLKEKVKCLVLFYGVPLRVDQSLPESTSKSEMDQLTSMAGRVREQVIPALQGIERLARTLDPSFRENVVWTPAGMEKRAIDAIASCEKSIRYIKGPDQRTRRNELARARQMLESPAVVPELGAPQKPTTKPTQERIVELSRHQDDPVAREELRRLAHFSGGKIGLLSVLETQKAAIGPENTDASVDSEITLLWHDSVARKGWIVNPFSISPDPVSPEQAIMVSRLDGPNPDVVRRMIDRPVAVEQEGLSGPIVLDARGIEAKGDNASIGTYGWYDQSIRNLESILKSAGVSDVIFDNAEPLMPNGSGKDAAIYLGWYALRRYSPTCSFRPGAIGVHIASLELNWMRDETDGSWCKGLLRDGADVTLGAVNEPYLIAFPPADEFFPLLMTGQLTLADVYWITIPMTSWKVSLLGDPLYRPFLNKPLLDESKLPEKLRGFLP